MLSFTTTTLSGHPYIDGLTEGAKWALDGSRTITYSLWDEYGDPGMWSSEETMIRAAFQSWANVADIRFVERPGGETYMTANADITVKLTGNALDYLFGSGAQGLGIFPSSEWGDLWIEVLDTISSEGVTRADYPHPEGDIFLDNDDYWWYYRSDGDMGLAVAIHEIGHALGLKHPHDEGQEGHSSFYQLGLSPRDTAAGGGLDDYHFTVMSYDSPYSYAYGHAATPMPGDILAIQHLYGANMSYRTGDDTYSVHNSDAAWRTIWDAGGIDTLSLASWPSYYSWNANIDLRPGALNSNYWDDGGYAIAYNVSIENAVGSTAANRITGHDGNNEVWGQGGSDTILGLSGEDRLWGQDGHDSLYGNMGRDTLYGGYGSDTIYAGKDDDTLSGDADHDVLAGNMGHDILRGGGGNDLLWGGQDNDVLWGENGWDTLAGDLGDDVLYGGGDGDIFRCWGTTGSDTIGDFNPGDGDRISLQSGYHYTIREESAGVVVETAGGRVLLAGVPLSGWADWMLGYGW